MTVDNPGPVTEKTSSTKSSGLLRLPIHEIASMAGLEQEMAAPLILPAPSTTRQQRAVVSFCIVLPRATVIAL
jgi:hypothetical protein